MPGNISDYEEGQRCWGTIYNTPTEDDVIKFRNNGAKNGDFIMAFDNGVADIYFLNGDQFMKGPSVLEIETDEKIEQVQNQAFQKGYEEAKKKFCIDLPE